ncbi:hypothetical protein HNR42_002578 [Deinobacterium chartae]|uniref:Uncharacterized protein n=1 Tax=Deinobacterium chartae TaxID=521158 RepID=A0A841I5B9_9DEIO|nr:hypothetical protein [Deinobacterium chartae]MBB6099142.1 hypothetical protein [Deinobacterium chartae]
MSSDVRKDLNRLATALRRFHLALLEHTKSDYERQFGKIDGPFTLFNLVIGDPHFQWLRPLSGLMATLDEVIDSKTELGEANIRDVERALAELFSPLDPRFEEFRRFYGRYRLEADVQRTEAAWRAVLVGMQAP